MHPAAKRTHEVRYAIRDVVIEARKVEATGKKVLYLNIGDPLAYDWVTPPHMIEAVHRAMLDGHNGYSDSMGVPEARAAVARSMHAEGVPYVKQDDVILASGASEGISMALGAILERGGNVLTPSPGYPQYTALVSFFEGVMNPYYLDEDNGWVPDLADIEKRINPETRAIILINPNNPTGSFADEKIVRGIVDIARRHNLIILSDEIYHKLLFEGTFYSPAKLAGDVPVLVFNGLSKSYFCPGWRVGWIVVCDPENKIPEVREAIGKLARMRLCINSQVQYAVKPALEGPQDHIPAALKRLRERGDLCVKRLNSIHGLSCQAPRGAFYAFPRIDNPAVTCDRDFMLRLLREEGVLWVNGGGFGQKPDTKHGRIVFLPPIEILSESMDRIEKFVERNYR
ncbi:MAG: aminotransferase class I/II-fold pyridoxal phosphate-dependent enzyme [Candidatus Brocadiia bacterium]